MPNQRIICLIIEFAGRHAAVRNMIILNWVRGGVNIRRKIINKFQNFVWTLIPINFFFDVFLVTLVKWFSRQRLPSVLFYCNKIQIACRTKNYGILKNSRKPYKRLCLTLQISTNFAFANFLSFDLIRNHLIKRNHLIHKNLTMSYWVIYDNIIQTSISSFHWCIIRTVIWVQLSRVQMLGRIIAGNWFNWLKDWIYELLGIGMSTN